MDGSHFVVLGFFIGACLLAIHQSRDTNWDANQQIGTAVFLAGTAIGLFLDDLLPATSPLSSWIGPVGALVMIAGLLVSWFWKPI